jgi:mRNA-degrading endonuclease RelE of RelBE toxin-antitoxin system
MKIEVTRQFVKDLETLPLKIQQGVAEAYTNVAKATGIHEILNCKKLAGSKHHYRIRVGSYRVLFLVTITADTVIFKRVVPRGGAYKKHIQ